MSNFNLSDSSCLSDYFSLNSQELLNVVYCYLQKKPVTSLRTLKDRINSYELNDCDFQIVRGEEIVKTLSRPKLILKMYLLSKKESLLYLSTDLDAEIVYFLNRVADGSIVIKSNFELVFDVNIDNYIRNVRTNSLQYTDWFNSILSYYKVRSFEDLGKVRRDLYQCHCRQCPKLKDISINWIGDELHIDKFKGGYGYSTVFQCFENKTNMKSLSYFLNNKFISTCSCQNCILCKIPKVDILKKILIDLKISDENYLKLIDNDFKLSEINRTSSCRNVSKFIVINNALSGKFNFPKIRRSVFKDKKVLRFANDYVKEVLGTVSPPELDFDFEEELALMRCGDSDLMDYVLDDPISVLLEKDKIEEKTERSEYESNMVQREYDLRDAADKVLNCTSETYDPETRSGKLHLSKIPKYLEFLEEDIKETYVQPTSLPKFKNIYHEENRKKVKEPKCRAPSRKCDFSTEYTTRYQNKPKPYLVKIDSNKSLLRKRYDEKTEEMVWDKIFMKKERESDRQFVSDIYKEANECRSTEEGSIIKREQQRLKFSSSRVIEKFKTRLVNAITEAMPSKMKKYFTFSRTTMILQIYKQPRRAVEYTDTQDYYDFGCEYRNIINDFRSRYRDIIIDIVQKDQKEVYMPSYIDFQTKLISRFMRRVLKIKSRKTRAKLMLTDVNSLLNIMLEETSTVKRIDKVKEENIAKGSLRNQLVRIMLG
jgi:hypothetical protein